MQYIVFCNVNFWWSTVALGKENIFEFLHSSIKIRNVPFCVLQRLFIIAFAVIAAVAADVSHVLNPEGYHYEPPKKKLCEDGIVREDCDDSNVIVEVRECAPPRVGRYPNCVLPPCPPGYQGTYPNCQKPRCASG